MKVNRYVYTTLLLCFMFMGGPLENHNLSLSVIFMFYNGSHCMNDGLLNIYIKILIYYSIQELFEYVTL